MSLDMVNDVLDLMAVDPTDDGLLPFMDNIAAPYYFPLDASQTSLEPWATNYVPDQAHATQSGSFQFGCPGEEKNDDFINYIPELALPTQWWYPEDHGAVWDGAYNESQYSSSPPFESTGVDLPIDGDPTPSASTSSTATGSPSHLWDSLTPPKCNTTYPGIDSAAYMDGSSTEFMTTGIEPTTGFSWVDNAVIEPHVMSHQSTSTQSQRTPAGWTYQEILETVAFKPRGAPHLWHAKISQLAAHLGMPIETTAEDIVTFVIHVAAARNELDKVAPLVRALAGAARLLEGRDIVPHEMRPLVAKLYPGVARWLGFLECAGEADLNTAQQSHCDEVSLASRQSSDSPTNPDEIKEQAAESKPARRRQRVAEEDLYCRVDTCLESFKDPHVCAKHRRCHFTQVWRCPGPCRTQTSKEGWFARKETLKRHLHFRTFAECKEVALKVLHLEELPTSSTEWMAPFREGTERPWECGRFQLTDLQTVKEWLRDPNFTAPPAAPLRGRHRPKKRTSAPLNFTTYVP